MSKIDKHELCFKSIISALSQLDKLNLGSYEQRTEVITTLLNKFEIINTDKLQHQLEIQTKRVENFKHVQNNLDEFGGWLIESKCPSSVLNLFRESRSLEAIDQELEKQLEEVK